MGKTTIEWTDQTWNPISGCTKVSPGCDHCYAETLAERFRGTLGHYFENGFDVQLRPNKLEEPLHWKKPRRVFVNSMSDLFHGDIPDDYIAKVWSVMLRSPQHTFQILTKRPGRMRSILNSPRLFESMAHDAGMLSEEVEQWPLPNVWLGVSAENQLWADVRIPKLLNTPAVVRFVSAEPLLGPLDLNRYIGDPSGLRDDWTQLLDWVIVGGESGRGARPMHPDWARSICDQCDAAGIAFLFKQWGEWGPQRPIDCQPGDVAIDVDGSTHTIGASGLDELPIDVRRRSYLMRRVGKKAAGRMLTGRTWDEFPQLNEEAP